MFRKRNNLALLTLWCLYNISQVFGLVIFSLDRKNGVIKYSANSRKHCVFVCFLVIPTTAYAIYIYKKVLYGQVYFVVLINLLERIAVSLGALSFLFLTLKRSKDFINILNRMIVITRDVEMLCERELSFSKKYNWFIIVKLFLSFTRVSMYIKYIFHHLMVYPQTKIYIMFFILFYFCSIKVILMDVYFIVILILSADIELLSIDILREEKRKDFKYAAGDGSCIAVKNYFNDENYLQIFKIYFRIVEVVNDFSKYFEFTILATSFGSFTNAVISFFHIAFNPFYQNFFSFILCVSDACEKCFYYFCIDCMTRKVKLLDQLQSHVEQCTEKTLENIDLFYLRLTLMRLDINIIGFFTLNNNFTLAFTATVTTYVIVLYQFGYEMFS